MTRNVVIPEDILQKLKLLTRLENEINGIMLYRPISEKEIINCVVESIFFTGAGTGASVSRDPQRLKVINQFLQENPRYRVIDFHTHPERLGSYWHQNFSTGDIELFKEHLKDDPLYMGALITPVKEMLWAPDKPELKTCPPLPESIHEKIHRKKVVLVFPPYISQDDKGLVAPKDAI